MKGAFGLFYLVASGQAVRVRTRSELMGTVLVCRKEGGPTGDRCDHRSWKRPVLLCRRHRSWALGAAPHSSEGLYYFLDAYDWTRIGFWIMRSSKCGLYQ